MTIHAEHLGTCTWSEEPQGGRTAAGFAEPNPVPLAKEHVL